MKENGKKDSLPPEEKSRLIIEALFEKQLSSKLVERIRAWLAAGRDRKMKTDALRNVFDNTVNAKTVVPESTYVHLKKTKKRLGLPIIEYKVKNGMVEVPRMPDEGGMAAGMRRKRSLAGMSFRKHLMRAAAVVIPALILGGTVYFVSRHSSSDNADMVAAADYLTFSAGDVLRKRVTLPDGSDVYVCRGGSIRYPENFTDSRIVELDGEAYFSVAKMDGRPFTVNCGDLSVKVLGTEFRVSAATASGKAAEVAVAKGLVEVTTPVRTLNVNPRECLSYDAVAGDVTLAEVDAAEIAPWKDVDLDFDHKSLAEVFDVIGRFYGVVIVVDSGVSLDRTVMVRFDDSEPLGEVLYILCSMVGCFDYRMENDQVIITRK